MNKKYRRRMGGNFFTKLLMVLVFAFCSYVAIRIGIIGGNLLYNTDLKIVENTDTENFKITLNNSLPLIDEIYNSGNTGVSFLSEVKGLIWEIFEFDLNSPVTILNVQSPLFYSYYNKGYKSLVAQNEKNETVNKQQSGNDTADNKTTEDSGNKNGKPFQDPVASSITYEPEDRDFSGGNVVSNGKIVIQNETKFKIDIDKLLKEPLQLNFSKKGPRVLIYHTHTTESYVLKSADLNKKGVPNWTLDEHNSVVRVGEELAKSLRKKYSINVLHNGTVHDYPNYKSSYGNSLSTVKKYLKSYPSLRILLDIHRDGLGPGNPKLRVNTKINGKNAAQIMFVVGTNGTGLQHPNWKENLKLALKLQEKLNSKYPGLAKPIYISKNRYNQHETNGALIIEIGGDGNLLSECLESTKYLAEVIGEVAK